MRQQIFACLAGKNNASATLLQVFVYFGWPRGAGNCSMGLFGLLHGTFLAVPAPPDGRPKLQSGNFWIVAWHLGM